MAFDSSQQALRAEMLFDEREVPFQLVPTPAGITAGCAISVSFEEERRKQILMIVQEEKIEMRGIFRKTDSAYEQMI